MKSETPLFSGAGTAIVTPFCKGRVDYAALGNLIEIQIAGNIDAIIVCGTTGEAATLTEAEKQSVIRFTIDAVRGRVPVIAGTGSNNTSYAIRLSMFAAEAGVDGLLVVTPYYNKTSQSGLIAHYCAIADSTNLPLLLYHVPSRTGMDIAPQTYKTLASHPRIVGIKEASGNLCHILRLFEECGELFDIYSGNDDQIYTFLSQGSKGVISVVSNLMPSYLHDLCALYFQGKTEESRKKQTALLPLIRALFSEVNPIPVKEALFQMGIIEREYRLPLYPMEDTCAKQLREQLKRYFLLPQLP